MDHTKEPWLAVDGRNGPGCNIYGDEQENGKGKYSVNGHSHFRFIAECKNEKDARRIVACVNACAGMADPEKEIAALKNEIITPTLVQTARLVDSLAAVRAQRDDLLAALKEVIYCSEHFGRAYAGRDARDKAKSLIKRVENA